MATKTKNISNPNGANQHTPDERQQKCWEFYLETILKGVKNAKQSAIKAGYTAGQAKNITAQGWFREKEASLVRKEILSESEKVLKNSGDEETCAYKSFCSLHGHCFIRHGSGPYLQSAFSL